MGFDLAPPPPRQSCNKSEALPTALKDSAIIFFPFFNLDWLILLAYTCIKRAGETVTSLIGNQIKDDQQEFELIKK